MPEIGSGSADRSVARYSLDTDRVIATYDHDSVLEIDEETYRVVSSFDDATLSVTQVANIIHAVSRNYPQAELQSLGYVGEEWF